MDRLAKGPRRVESLRRTNSYPPDVQAAKNMFVRKGRSECGTETCPLGYVERPNDARTTPTSIFSILNRMLARGPRPVNPSTTLVLRPGLLGIDAEQAYDPSPARNWSWSPSKRQGVAGTGSGTGILSGSDPFFSSEVTRSSGSVSVVFKTSTASWANPERPVANDRTG